MLAALPSELLDMVIGHMASRKDLKRLGEVCKRLRDTTLPHLYRSLVLSAPELSLENLVAILEAIPWKYLKYTQSFGFSIPIHERVESRCVHHGGNGHFMVETVQDGIAESLTNYWTMGYENMDDENTAEGTDKGCVVCPLSKLSCELDYLRFPDDQLRSFRWEVGTCIPEAVFCGHDSFLGNQSQIQSINLITDGECGANKNAQYAVDLVQFRKLRSLDWKGLNRYNDFESVRECIRAHGHQIQLLTLDILT
ncbi:hypothetical protein BDW62DRAFT_187834 [Aspergillus aurantiobrunneus]